MQVLLFVRWKVVIVRRTGLWSQDKEGDARRVRGWSMGDNVEEFYPAKRAYLGARLQQPYHVIRDRQHDRTELALLLLLDRLAHPSGWASAAHHIVRPEW